MVGESLAIIAVIAVMSVMYLRSGRGQLAVLALPLLCLPLAHLLGAVIWNIPRPGEGSGPVFVYRCIALALGLLLGFAGSVVLSRKITYRRAYIVLGTIFSAALAVAYVMYLL